MRRNVKIVAKIPHGLTPGEQIHTAQELTGIVDARQQGNIYENHCTRCECTLCQPIVKANVHHVTSNKREWNMSLYLPLQHLQWQGAWRKQREIAYWLQTMNASLQK